MTKTAVVILNYNGEDYLKEFLPKVLKNSSTAEIIVADNKSTDNSIDLLKKDFPTVRTILLERNYGFAEGYNKALKEVEAAYIVLLNSDIEVTPKWLLPLTKFLDNNSDYAACQPKIKDYKHRDKFEYAGASGGFIDSLGYPFCRGRIFDKIEKDTGQYDNSIDIFWATGACLMIRSDLFKKSGGLDPDFFAHMEEIDLCWRIQSLGYKIKVIPTSEVYHVGGGTLSKLSPFKTYLNFRNGLFILLKNLPMAELVVKLPIRFFLDWIAALKFIVEGKVKHGTAVWKAHFMVMEMLSLIIRKRSYVSSPPYKGMILFKYYLRRKQKFSDLQ
ncbi:MAG: glycosyltransferase [Bacteroidota bacterium]